MRIYFTRKSFSIGVCCIVISLLWYIVSSLNIELKEKSSSREEIIETNCDYGPRGPRILCAIFTHRLVHKTTLLPVHNTWAKRYSFIISEYFHFQSLNYRIDFVYFLILNKMRQNHLHDRPQAKRTI